MLHAQSTNKRTTHDTQTHNSYAEYETKLEQLRQARRRGLGLSNAKQSLADYAIVKRVHFIFERAARKFKRDLGVWTRWLEFCRATRSNRRLSRVAARALQLHPTAPGLWAYAAAWEFEDNGNPAAARALMQQGLRMCADSRAMWLQYFGMELAYVARLRARRLALGLDVPAGDDGQEQEQEGEGQRRQQQPEQQQQEDGEGPMEEDGAGGGGGGGSGSILASLRDGGDAGGEDAEAREQERQAAAAAEAAVAAVLTGAVAGVVARSAAAALPGDLALRRGLLEALARYDFPGVAALRAAVAAGVESDFAGDAEAVDLLARHCDCDPAALPAAAGGKSSGKSSGKGGGSGTDERFEAAVARYEAAIAAAAAAVAADDDEEAGEQADAGAGGASRAKRAQQRQQRRERLAALWRLYAAFLRERFEAALAASAAAGGDEARVAAAAAAAQALLRALQRAHEAGAASEGVYELWADAALRLGHKKMALKAAQLACAAHAASPGAWARRVALEAQLRGPGPAAAARLLAVLREALAAVPADRAPGLWTEALRVCTAPGDLGQLAALLVESRLGAARAPASGGLGAAAAAVLSAVWDACGADAGRALFAKLAALPPAGGDLYRRMVELEGAALEAAVAATGCGSKAGSDSAAAVGRVRRVLEAAVDAYGDCDAALWLAYARFEQRHARRGAGPIYWRAVKALADADEFVQEYRRSVSADV